MCAGRRLISADGDLAGAIEVLKELRPELSVVVALPPRRRSRRLTDAADASFTIGAYKIRRSQLPDTVTAQGGTVLKRPGSWR